MEFYRLTIPIPKQPWLWIRFRITTILLLVAIVAIVLTWRRDHQQMAAEVARLQYPGPHYEAAQATGAPDVENQGDSASAWCPAEMDAGKEWLLLEYESAVVPKAIIVHENYDPCAVVRVSHYPMWGREETLWEGTYTPTTGPSGSEVRLPITSAVKTNRIKVHLDTAAASGWNEIDAVGLVYGNNKVIWASKAKASSTWASVQR